MAPRLILSNAQKSAGTHAPISAGSFCGARRKFEAAAKGSNAAETDIGLPKMLARYPTFIPVSLTASKYDADFEERCSRHRPAQIVAILFSNVSRSVRARSS